MNKVTLDTEQQQIVLDLVNREFRKVVPLYTGYATGLNSIFRMLTGHDHPTWESKYKLKSGCELCTNYDPEDVTDSKACDACENKSEFKEKL